MNNTNFLWTNELVLHMIDLYEEKPELWDNSSEDYNDKEKKQIAWLEIANAINADVYTVQKKIKMLMSQFRREQSRKPGSKSQWFAYKRMLFLGPRQPIVRRFKYNKPRHDEAEPATYFFSMAPNQLHELKSDNSMEGDLQRKEHIVINDILGNYDEPRRKSRKKSQPDTIQQEVLNTETQGKDEYATYGELVAMKLRKLESTYARSTAQYHINNILYKAEIGIFDKSKKSGQDNSFQRHDSIDDENSSSASVSKSANEFFKLDKEDSDD